MQVNKIFFSTHSHARRSEKPEMEQDHFFMKGTRPEDLFRRIDKDSYLVTLLRKASMNSGEIV